MKAALSTRLLRAVVVVALTCATAATMVATASAEEYTKEYEKAYEIGIKGYEYGEPLLNMQRLFQSNTSVTVPDTVGDAPINQFSHFTELATTKEGEIIAPNADTIYSSAWLELKGNPIVVHVPATPGRFNVVPLYSPVEENFANIGEGASGMLAPGNYVIAGPNKYAGEEEIQGMKIIHSPYDRVWMLPRVEVKSKADEANAVAIQAEEKLVPLKAWKKEGLNYKSPAPEKEVTVPTSYHVPGTQAGEEPNTYWNALGAALKQFKPPAADAPELELLKTVGIAPGKFPVNNAKLSAGTIAGLRAAVAAGPGVVFKHFKEIILGGFNKHNGWGVTRVGTYGTNYTLRAVADQDGLAALAPNISIYPFATTERKGVPLTGASGKKYVVHFPPGDTPPVTGFWSVTMYATTGYFVPNVLERFTLGNRSNLQYEEDGSLNMYLQSEQPTGENEQANWLPSPEAGFQVIMRLYGPEESQIEPILEGTSSFTPPTILPCKEPENETAEGVKCAS